MPIEPTTELILTIRPQRAFVIGLTHAFDSRNTALRLVLITSNHSSSFIRINILSLVIPALFISTVGAPKFSTTLFKRALIESGSVTFNGMPAPKIPLSTNRWLMLSAPEVVVAVPMTVYPDLPRVSAIAAPIPRLAPVTNTTFDSSLIDSPLII